MPRADLHVHSKFSNHPTEWFLQRLGASESYTEPDFIYRSAKERGMDFVTVTDHNRIEGSLFLKEKHPEECFTGVESTAYFPEDGCKVHMVIFGFEERQFREIQTLRKDIYELRELLVENHLAHSIAHATFSVNGRLTISHIERLMLLFDVFEGSNGGRNAFHNTTWTTVLSSLTPEKIDDLWKRYRIEPRSKAPWIKGFTGGSDDHAGLFIGRTYTEAPGGSLPEFLDNIRDRKAVGAGRHNDYKSLAFMFYKVAYDFYRQKSGSASPSFLSQLSEHVFDRKNFGLKDKLLLRRLRSSSKKGGDKIPGLVFDLLDQIEEYQASPLEDRLDLVYETIAEIADEFFKLVLQSLERDVHRGDVLSLIKNLSASIPGIFLSIPFFSTIKLSSDNKPLLRELMNRYAVAAPKKRKNILWFTDTLEDLNGVSMTLQKIGNLALEKDLPLQIVSSARDEEEDSGRPLIKSLNLPTIHSFRMPGYETYLINIPSVLHSLEKIYRADPDEIIISTPGPVGLLGLLAASLLNVKSVGIYHTDFTLQAQKIIPDESVVRLLESLVRSFYSAMDEIQVPTQEYIHILEQRDYDLSRLKIFRRGVDVQMFSPRPGAGDRLRKKLSLGNDFLLLYAGRVSQDKDLDFLVEVYERLLREEDGISLLIVGDGPYLNDLKARTKNLPGICFMGRLDYGQLPQVYSAAELFVFPSTTDTFGMVVIEAQACGLPAVVSDRGGPKEIIVDHQTGLIAAAGSVDAWVSMIRFVRSMKQSHHQRYVQMKEEARRHILQNYSWDGILEEMFDEEKASSFRLCPQQRPEPNGRGLSQRLRWGEV